MAQTAQNVIDSARYDLVDFVDGVGTGIEYDDVELLNHLNRMIGLLDSHLSALRSDLVEAEETDIDCVLGQNYVDISTLNSGLWNRIRSVWIGSNMLEQVSLGYMRYTRMYRSGNARPTIWALWNDQILFPAGCDSSYTTLNIYYDKKTDTLELDDTMPYNDRFNEFLREMTVMSAKLNHGNDTRGDAVMDAMFRSRAYREIIQREFVPRPYKYWRF